MPSRCSVLALLFAGLCGLGLPAVASAALPVKSAAFEAHDHESKGKKWHVQLEISKNDPQVVETLVLYSEACKVTIAATRVPISDDGALKAHKVKEGGNAWAIDATFTAKGKLEGVAHLGNAKCYSGALAFKATSSADGHTDHEHAAKTDDHGGKGGRAGGHHGPTFPTFSGASANDMEQVYAMRRAVFEARNELFPSLGAALSKGFVMIGNKRRQRPVAFHVRSEEYDTDEYIFNSRRPESLVYWYPSVGKPILIGMMFRVENGPRPSWGGPIPIYHGHVPEGGGAVPNQMTHVWLTRDLKTAYANCMPVKALEATIPAFKYENSTQGVANTRPCPD